MDNEPDYSRLHIIGRTIGVAIVIGAVAASIYAFRRNFVNPRTDDAAVRANVVGIAPQVSGPIVDLRVTDNQHVKEGDLLFTIDCRPYEARLDRARARGQGRAPRRHPVRHRTAARPGSHRRCEPSCFVQAAC